jgi:hypothetical protein
MAILKRFAMNVGFIECHPDSLQYPGDDTPIDAGALEGHTKTHFAVSSFEGSYQKTKRIA